MTNNSITTTQAAACGAVGGMIWSGIIGGLRLRYVRRSLCIRIY